MLAFFIRINNMSTALITGASKGIGKTIAEELARRKINLLLVARSGDLLNEIGKDLSNKYGIKVDWLSLDLADRAAARKIFEWAADKHTDLNILVNNVGYGLSGPFERYPIEEYLDLMHVNMNLTVELCSLVLPLFRNQTKSYILNIASSAAFQAVPGLNVYAASKAFIRSFSRGLRYELRKTPISVTVVCPGSTATNFASRAQVGPKALKAAKTYNTSPEKVGKMAVNAMFSRRSEVTTGFINKVLKFFVWLMPRKLSEKTAAGIYEV